MSAGVCWPIKDGLFSRQVVPCTMEKSTERCAQYSIFHAWQQHIIITHFQELWKLLMDWIQVTEEAEFIDYWTRIQALAPASFTQYITKYWLPVWPMWSAREWKDHTISAKPICWLRHMYYFVNYVIHI